MAQKRTLRETPAQRRKSPAAGPASMVPASVQSEPDVLNLVPIPSVSHQHREKGRDESTTTVPSALQSPNTDAGSSSPLAVAQTPLKAASGDVATQENPYLDALDERRGNRAKYSTDSILDALERLQSGASVSRAAELSGMRRATLYDLGDKDPNLKAAIVQSYARGSDAYEDAVEEIALHDGDARRAPAIKMALQLRGKLQDRGSASTNVQVNASQVILALGDASPAQLRTMADRAEAQAIEPAHAPVREGA